MRDQNGPRRALAYLLQYLRSVGTEPKVARFTLAHQVGLMKWLGANHELSNKTISTYLSYIKAAFRFCARPHLIMPRGPAAGGTQLGDRSQRNQPCPAGASGRRPTWGLPPCSTLDNSSREQKRNEAKGGVRCDFEIRNECAVELITR
jgi:hypothetical protein